MHDLHAISGAAKMFADFFRNHDGAVLSAGATEGDGQITLAFVDVVRQQVNQQIGDAGDEFPGLRKRANVLGEARMTSGERPEFGDEMRVGQEADIEHQVGVFGNALTKSETHARDQNALFRGLLFETLGDVSAEFVNVELGSVDDEIGDSANGAQMAAFSL